MRTLPKCPKCNTEMIELEEDIDNMSDGQQSDYFAGFNRTFSCPNCGCFELFDVEVNEFDDDEIDELIEIIEINPESFEDVIENALKSKCFIEAISLIHNVIEAYLKYRLKGFFGKDKERLDLLKSKIKFNYLKDYNGFCYILNLINKDEHDKIIQFNKDRNKAIHELLKKKMKISDLKLIARNGREIQMKLSPLNHTTKDINEIMIHFNEITK